MFRRFIERPVLSAVISILIVILGILGYIEMPVSLYPTIAPPTVQVRATYPGANAKTVLKSVVAPLEEQINGVEGMTYMNSTASNNGSAQINVFFKLGTDPDIAAVDVQNRVAQAKSKLPQEVTQTGVTTQKQQSSRLLIFSLYSPNGKYGTKFIENYARIHLIPQLKRVQGVGSAHPFGSKTYAMRIWLKPALMASYGVTPNEVISSLNSQSFTAAPGAIGQNSGQSFEYTLTYKGRLSTTPQFKNIVIRADSAHSKILRLKDIARVKLGSESYSEIYRTDGEPGVGIAISQRAGSNAQQVVANVLKKLKKASKTFPSGLDYTNLFNANSFLNASTSKVYETFIEAFVLVCIVVLLFLQDWKSTLIPAVAIPVSIVGTFFILNLFGYSLNLLTLFALVLAIGIVVDNAIIVVEIIYARFEEGAETGMQAAIEGMSEIAEPIISITLVMAAIFVPVTFIPGSIGVFFQEFGVTLATSIVISGIVALTLSPALSAIVLSPEYRRLKDESTKSYLDRFKDGFNTTFEKTQYGYRKSLEFLTRHVWIVIVGIIAFFFLFWGLYSHTPSGFVPNEDQGVFFANIALPPSSSLQRTQSVLNRLDKIMASEKSIKTRLVISGFGIISGRGSSYGFAVGRLKKWSKRDKTVNQVIADLQKKTSKIKAAQITFFSPPVITGFGNTSGFTMHLQQVRGNNIDALSTTSKKVQRLLSQQPAIQYAASYFSTNYPQYKIDVDVAKAKKAGISPRDILNVIQVYYGGAYISNFNRFGKLYRVYVQAGPKYRSSKKSLQNIYVRNGQGRPAPVSSFVTLKRVYGPENLSRFNLYNSVQITGATNPGYSSGQAISAIKKVFKNKISPKYSYAFSGLTRQQSQSSGEDIIIFALCLVFVYFLLSAQYESFLIPWSVILPLPIGLAGSFIFANIFGIANNIYLQISSIMLMGLLAKNAILIVQFAVDRRREEGMSIRDAAINGSVARLRPILMTSFAFIAGLLPLAAATGVNAHANRSIGIGTVGGMFIGTFFGLFAVPIMYVVFQRLQEKISGPPGKAQE
ncbi:MAG TPA: efflux RND transporter permease subunit [Balneolaceae bacterium]|nr:efflux RND transporter permease subunit [Balneolaceae bacterium]